MSHSMFTWFRNNKPLFARERARESRFLVENRPLEILLHPTEFNGASEPGPDPPCAKSALFEFVIWRRGERYVSEARP